MRAKATSDNTRLLSRPATPRRDGRAPSSARQLTALTAHRPESNAPSAIPTPNGCAAKPLEPSRPRRLLVGSSLTRSGPSPGQRDALDLTRNRDVLERPLRSAAVDDGKNARRYSCSDLISSTPRARTCPARAMARLLEAAKAPTVEATAVDIDLARTNRRATPVARAASPPYRPANP